MLPVAIQDLVCGQGARETVHLARLVLRQAAAAAQGAAARLLRRAMERRELRTLDGRMLRDARIGPCEAHALLQQPLWHA
jgi:uncharacterized protein YjiS (DUF1127 family)